MSSQPKPECFATELLTLREWQRPLFLEKVARSLDLEVRDRETKAYEGVLLRRSHRLGGIISIRRGIREPGRRRFTIAHEIGHYTLNHQRIGVCTFSDVHEWMESDVTEEVAANRFATELLLPKGEISQLVSERGVSIKTAEFLKRRFAVSLTTAAKRCVEVAKISCALVIVVNRLVHRYRRSSTWPFGFSTRIPVSKDSFASKLFDGISQTFACGRVKADVWVNIEQVSDFYVELFEDSVYLPSYKTCLSLLTFPDQRRH